MKKLKDKIVYITGASSGIGKACAEAFAKEGAKLIISARRANIIENIAEEIRKKFKVEVFAQRLDVKNKKEVEWMINSLPEEWKKIDILINNAGLAQGMAKIYEDDVENWDNMIDTNVKGLLYVTRAVVPGMVEREKGHVINIGSTAGHEAYPKGHVYCATKHAVNGITKALRMDVVDKNIRVSTVDPGAVETNFSNVRFFGDKEKAKNMYKGIIPLVAEDVAEAVLFCATRPPHANIAEIIMMPTQQASAIVFHRTE
ncbi:MAG: SDR family oxidoreductase [Ignavibacteriales bacterium]|nr:SDR family oxidoreductase [Ignavibacteriales bacterium]MBK7980651.1 SDR family oxidoreductase [Ignavibacteriota bacterium]